MQGAACCDMEKSKIISWQNTIMIIGFSLATGEWLSADGVLTHTAVLLSFSRRAHSIVVSGQCYGTSALLIFTAHLRY